MTRDEDLARYNCTDACVTWDIWDRLGSCLKDDGLKSADAFQQRLFGAVLRTMHRGVRFNEKRRDELRVELEVERDKRLAWIEHVLGEPLNIGSSVQMRKLFFEQLRCSPGKDKALDDNALSVHADREPLLAPLIKVIRELRSINVFSRNFLEMQADEDGRMRCSYNIAGTTTYRLSSSENCFGRGGNLQNLPKGGDDDEGLCLPNIRSLFIPDDGYTIFDLDLSKADLRIVVWEADEQEAKAMLREGRDPYVELAREFYKDNTIKKTRNDGSEHPLYRKFKSFAHGTNYMGSAKGIAYNLGLTVKEAESTQDWYFGKFPGIKRYQERIVKEITGRKFVRNVFGYRHLCLGRVDDHAFKAAAAWIPQSTIGILINHIWLAIAPYCDVLMQVHDSLVGQFATYIKDVTIDRILEESRIALPYNDPLVIPVGVKTSDVSWGEVR